jgi:phage tail sheath protein FI
MTTPLTPGVYVREASGGARAIQAAPTAVTIFVGETERGPVGPTSITSPVQFERLFGGFFRAEAGGVVPTRLFMPYAIRGFFANGGPRAYVLRLVSNRAARATAPLWTSPFASVQLGDGVATATVRAAAPGLAGNLIQVRIADASDADPNHFNLTVRISTDDGATFPDRSDNPTFENLNTDDGDPNNVRTRLDNDPDIRWDGPALRPDNGDFTLTGPAGDSALQAVAPGMFGNSIRIAVDASTDRDPERFNLIVFYRPPGEVAFERVERYEGLSPNPTDEKYCIDQLARSAYVRWTGRPIRAGAMGNPAAEPPGIALVGGTGGDVALPVGDYDAALSALDGVDDAALIVCASDGMLNAADAAAHNDLINAVLGYVERRPQRDLFLVADAPRSTPGDDPVADAVAAARTGITASDYLGLYWPRIVVADPAGVGRNPTRPIPAAGHVAGLYGRTDGRRGVWKVAAGVEATLAGTVGLDVQVLDQDQDRMNPHGLNALRTIPGAGRVVWGGRTTRPTSEWRYINVRRTAMFLRKSIYNNIQWAVFEGNDERLWAALRESIGSFMEAQFRNGAFAGATSREAYFVKCDADTTTPDDQAAGIVNVQVGFAPLRPAEFVIVTLSQMSRR